jgi:hypothetical protein
MATALTLQADGHAEHPAKERGEERILREKGGVTGHVHAG